MNHLINQQSLGLSNAFNHIGNQAEADWVGNHGANPSANLSVNSGMNYGANSGVDADVNSDRQTLSIAAISESIQPTKTLDQSLEQPTNRLLTVQFDQRRNRLEILAQQALVPQIYVSNGSEQLDLLEQLDRSSQSAQSQRLWIDLPNISVDRISLQRSVGQTIKFIQVEPLNFSSTRVWLEMAETVALKPHLIELQAQAPNYWFVQLANWRLMCDRHYSGRHPPRLNYVLPLVGEIRVGYGWRIHPVFKDWQFHRGIDIAAPLGTPIVTAAAGTVHFAGWNNSGYGNLLVIEHSDRSKTLYAHSHKILVRQGEYIEAGKAIALTGSTGNSIESHLHFEVLPDGRHTANPVDYLPTITGAEFYLAHNPSRAFRAAPNMVNSVNTDNTASIAINPHLPSYQTAAAVGVVSPNFLAT